MKPHLSVNRLSRTFVKRADIFERIARKLGAGLGAEDETVHAVDDISFEVFPGEVVGLVGESGCGKSSVGRMLAGIIPPSSGDIVYRGRTISANGSNVPHDALLPIQMVFQNPFASLNPRKRVIDIIGTAPEIHGIVSRTERDGYVSELMERVGLDPAVRNRYPHQFSGGQRQRIGIARALAVKPDFLICDEAIAALDVSIQAQIINLFTDLRTELNLTYLFISHDLSVVENISDRVLIMYLGRIVESGTVSDIFDRPNHPYTQALLEEIPRLDRRKQRFTTIKGEIPSPIDPPKGCHFHPRCPFAMDRCRIEAPVPRQIAPGHNSACHLNDD